MLHNKSIYKLLALCGIFLWLNVSGQTIPLPEHPRPDFERAQWLNLNGTWDFSFDNENKGIDQKWYNSTNFNQKIVVPFPWGSELSGVENKSDIGWYSRTIQVPESFAGKRTFLVIGASDWITDVWIDGNHLGTHQGGYTPFEFDLTPFVSNTKEHKLAVRVDDTPHDFKLEGKQGYGAAKGIWQTVYLEARGSVVLKNVHFTPDIDQKKVTVKAMLDQPATENMTVKVNFPNKELSLPVTSPTIKKNDQSVEFEISIPDQRLWSLDDPYLYNVAVTLNGKDKTYDEVNSYFGMRKISVANLPGTDYPYVMLNNKPIYLQLCLDQAYHPKGFYTYPSDEFMRDEIIRSKKIGLNGNRIHIKVEVPRKLYWADKLGLLIMADVPNWWGEPVDAAFNEWDVAMRGMIDRDYNHPAIFSWVLFNETWGLFSGEGNNRKYLPETQERVKSRYLEAKKLDKTRLVEDNSPCNYDHTLTDMNTWHAYLPGYEWGGFLTDMVKNTYPGSTTNYINGHKQTNAPMFNSECGNVWGYEGSTGDVDWSWDYHIMMNEFRKHPKVAGWLYTEHHDVINEWNGYYKFDRSDKITGLTSFIPEMDLAQLHSSVYLSTGSELCQLVKPASTVKVPLFLSVMTDKVPANHFVLKYELAGTNNVGVTKTVSSQSTIIPSRAYFNGPVDSLAVVLPNEPGLYHLKLTLSDETGYVYHLNFTSFLVEEEKTQQQNSLVTFAPSSFTESKWSQKQWNVFDGLKVNGAGFGHFTYNVTIPSTISLEDTKNVTLLFEASSKELLGKDRDKDQQANIDGDFMRGKGTFDNSVNPNAYPMTDTYKYPSLVKVRVNGKVVGEFYLEDDPADHRGVLSWFSQKRDKKLVEAGTYGYLCKAKIPVELLKGSATMLIQFEVDSALPGGLAIYGKRFGRYPFDPTIIFD
jgi:hypothetical protein